MRLDRQGYIGHYLVGCRVTKHEGRGGTMTLASYVVCWVEGLGVHIILPGPPEGYTNSIHCKECEDILGLTQGLQCSSFLGLLWFCGKGLQYITQKGTT